MPHQSPSERGDSTPPMRVGGCGYVHGQGTTLGFPQPPAIPRPPSPLPPPAPLLSSVSVRVTTDDRLFIRGLIEHFELTPQHEELLLGCWSRSRSHFSSDERVCRVVMRILVVIVARYLGPRRLPLPTTVSQELLGLAYKCVPDVPFVLRVTPKALTWYVFLNVLGGRVK